MPNPIINKPWGFERKLTDDSLPYAGKIAFTKAGCRWSLQSHDQKQETITLLYGQAKISLGSSKDNLTTTEMIVNQGYNIPPNIIHRFEATTDCLTVETSTPEAGNTIRLEDDYQRRDETEEIRNLPDRGWNNSYE